MFTSEIIIPQIIFSGFWLWNGAGGILKPHPFDIVVLELCFSPGRRIEMLKSAYVLKKNNQTECLFHLCFADFLL